MKKYKVYFKKNPPKLIIIHAKSMSNTDGAVSFYAGFWTRLVAIIPLSEITFVIEDS